jgi:predicted secreted protein
MSFRIFTKLVFLICIIASLSAFYKEPIVTRENKIFKVRLEQQASSNYVWTYVEDKVSKRYVTLLKTDFESDNPKRLSTSGKKIFTFKALKPGRIKINFTKKQSWEQKEIDKALVKVHIKRGR